MTKIQRLALVIPAVVVSFNCCADERWELSLGGAAGVGPQYIGSDEFELYAFPIIEASYYATRRTKLFGGTVNGLGIEQTVGNLVLGLGLGYRYGLYGPDDVGLLRDKPEELAGMWDPGDSATVKPSIRTNHEVWNLKLEYEQGLKSTNEGWTTKLALSYNYYFNEKIFGKVAADSVWGNKEFVDAYFGISGTEVREDRAFYEGEADLYNYGLSAETNYMVNPQNVLFVSATVGRLSDEVAKSDLVKENVQLELTLAYVHLF